MIEFIQHTFPAYKVDPFHAYVASYLDRVVSGEISKLMVFSPPQHGKSLMTSIHFPAFWLGRRPHDPVIITSYGSNLAQSKSRHARTVVESAEFAQLFPEVKTEPSSRAVDLWELARPSRSQVRAAGVGAGLSGHPASLGLIDDPVVDWSSAQSERQREVTWEWYQGTFRTRVWENGAIVLIQCMTGDTPVLMADESSHRLRDIKVGDQVATYDNGKLNTSAVKNHRNSGYDSVFAIRTTCGKIVHANERHPFLVEEHGQLKWIRLKNLTTAHRIVTVKDNGANGEERPAPLQAVENPLVVEGTASHTTARRCGPMGIAHHRSTQTHAGMRILSTDMESLSPSMMRCAQRKMANVLFASDPQVKMCAPIGVGSCVLTTTMIPTLLEDFFVTIATSPWGIPKQRQPHTPLLNISDFTTTQIAAIEPAGIQEVFDIQIERTGNFIANGLVSHNTRWHVDDLAGMLLQEQEGQWIVLRLPALAEEQDERDFINESQGLPVGGPDPLGRAPGEPLAPSLFSKDALLDIKKEVGSMVWASEYQGAPVLAEGNMFKRDWFHIAERVPDGITRRARYWDFAASKEGKARTSGVLLSIDKDGIIYIEDVAVGFWSPKERNQMIRIKAEQDHAKYSNYGKLWFEQEPGSAGKEIAQQMVRDMAGYTVRPDRPTGDKDTRLDPFRSQAEGNNVRLIRGPWIKEYLNEMCAVPNGRFRDQADATAGAYNQLAGKHITVARFDNVSTSIF